MSELVNRLRVTAARMSSGGEANDIRSAAAEIERLTALLEEAANIADSEGAFYAADEIRNLSRIKEPSNDH